MIWVYRWICLVESFEMSTNIAGNFRGGGGGGGGQYFCAFCG